MLRNWNFALAAAFTLAVEAVGANLSAAEHNFPYEAVCVGERVDVRCGPGERYYVTSRLNPQDRVIVHRHDHGGWYMIEPPAGSFSWIEASLVERTGPDRGIVRVAPSADGTPARAIVRIGSTLSDEHAFYGRELSNGDSVVILGERTLNTDQGPVPMLRIQPPRQEFRWVKGDFVVPADEQERKQDSLDPYSIPPHLKQSTPPIASAPPQDDQNGPMLVAGPLLGGNVVQTANSTQFAQIETPSTSISFGTPSSQAASAAFDALDAIDTKYKTMMRQPPSKWDLDSIVAEYEQVRQTSGSPTIAELVTERLSAVESRRSIQRQFQDFMKLANETSRRDAELAARQEQALSQPVEGEAAPLSSNAFPEPESLSSSANGSIAPLVPPMEPGLMPPAEPGFTPAPVPNGPGDETVEPRLNGAGIVQAVQAPIPGLPRFVLIAPDGRQLAVLEATAGVSLDEWAGKPAGIYGQRAFDARYGLDRIVVRRLIPIQLAP